MTCSPHLVEAWFDGELDAAQQAALEQHVASCQDCAALLARLQRQRTAIRSAAPHYDAPDELRQSVRTALRRESRSAADSSWRLAAIAASVLLVASLGWNVLQLRPRPAGDLAGDVLSGHIRSLLGDHLMEVVSTDQHTVKPWFAGKLDFSPEVKDLSSQGFPLAGGRVDYLDRHRVAALVYRRRQHTIGLFIWPSQSAGGESTFSRDGYHLLHWTNGSMTYWAVSDVSVDDLERFRSLFR